MDEALRRSAAHVLVADVGAPALDDPAAHHLRRVLRLRDGAAINVTDGRGRWRSCRLDGGDVAPDGDVVEVARPRHVEVAVAPPKGDRLDWLVQKCTEIGVSRITLLDSEWSVVRWAADRVDRQLARVRRVAAEAAMQSRRVWLPDVCGPIAAAAVLPRAAAAEPGGRPIEAADQTVAIGPEGGWSPTELALAADRVSLGPHVLRVETAAIVAAAAMVGFS